MKEAALKYCQFLEELTNLPLPFVYSLFILAVLLFLAVRYWLQTRHFRIRKKDKGNYHLWSDKFRALQKQKNLIISGKRGREFFKMGVSPLEAVNQIKRDQRMYTKGRKRLDAQLDKNIKKNLKKAKK